MLTTPYDGAASFDDAAAVPGGARPGAGSCCPARALAPAHRPSRRRGRRRRWSCSTRGCRSGLVGPAPRTPLRRGVHGAEVTVPGGCPASVAAARPGAARGTAGRRGRRLPARPRPSGPRAGRCPRWSSRRASTSTGSVRSTAAARPRGPPGVRRARPTRSRRARVSRLVPRKGFDVLIEAAARVRGQHAQLVVAIGGAGRDRRRLERLAAEHDVAGALPRPRARRRPARPVRLRRRVRHAVPQPLGRARAGGLRHRVPRGRGRGRPPDRRRQRRVGRGGAATATPDWWSATPVRWAPSLPRCDSCSTTRHTGTPWVARARCARWSSSPTTCWQPSSPTPSPRCARERRPPPRSPRHWWPPPTATRPARAGADLRGGPGPHWASIVSRAATWRSDCGPSACAAATGSGWSSTTGRTAPRSSSGCGSPAGRWSRSPATIGVEAAGHVLRGVGGDLVHRRAPRPHARAGRHLG